RLLQLATTAVPFARHQVRAAIRNRELTSDNIRAPSTSVAPWTSEGSATIGGFMRRISTSLVAATLVACAATTLSAQTVTRAKVLIDAQTGAVLSTKQFGGARGLTGFLRESAERKRNKAKAG